jgi:hypothetical protein
MPYDNRKHSFTPMCGFCGRDEFTGQIPSSSNGIPHNKAGDPHNGISPDERPIFEFFLEGVADRLTVVLTLTGTGSQEIISSDEKQDLLEFVQLLYQRLYQ